MKGSFRSRTFLLLLLFAVVPSVALTLVGYYLAVETPIEEERTGRAALQELTDYYGGLLYTDLSACADQFAAGQGPEGLDFVLVVTPDSIRILVNHDALTEDAVSLIDRAAAQRKMGLTGREDHYFQYVTRPLADGGYLVAGLVHDSTFAGLIENIRQSGASVSTQRELRGRYVAFVGGVFLTLMVLTVAAAYYLSSRVSRRLTYPLSALSEASRNIARGDFGRTVDVEAEGEIGVLIDSFNEMSQRLEEVTSRLAQTERVAAWRQVARRFAHELKNPLQPILVSLYRMEKQLDQSDQWESVREPLRAAAEEVKHLTRLAERFSSLAKLPPPKVEEIDLAGLVNSVADLYREKLQEFRFEVELPENGLTVKADATYLREALHNLLQNAADACRAGDEIRLTVNAGADSVELSVRDSGPGMDAATLASARLPYFTTKAKGNGLGLAIIDKFMTELGGRLQVDSTLGKGTTVAITLSRKVDNAG